MGEMGIVGTMKKCCVTITNPCKLYEGHHPIHLCPYMDEATRVLDNPTIFAPCILVGYENIFSSPPLVDSMVGQYSSLVDPVLLEIQFMILFPTNVGRGIGQSDPAHASSGLFHRDCVGVPMFWQIWQYQKMRQHQTTLGP